MIEGIVYLSDAGQDFTIDDLDALCKHARTANLQLGVTGYLCFARNRFIQYVEGEPKVLDTLLEKIYNDPRHTVLQSLKDLSIPSRRFPSWGMRYISPEELNRFNIELCIEQNLLYIKNDFGFAERCKKMIWQEIDSIAQLQNRIYA